MFFFADEGVTKLVIFYEHHECKTPYFFEAQHATSLGTTSEAFLKFSNTKHKFIFFTKYFSCNCIRIEMVFLVSHPVINASKSERGDGRGGGGGFLPIITFAKKFFFFYLLVK